jgi:hypothetical protein
MLAMEQAKPSSHSLLEPETSPRTMTDSSLHSAASNTLHSMMKTGKY